MNNCRSESCVEGLISSTVLCANESWSNFHGISVAISLHLMDCVFLQYLALLAAKHCSLHNYKGLKKIPAIRKSFPAKPLSAQTVETRILAEVAWKASFDIWGKQYAA